LADLALLTGIFASAFVSATILPGNSEAALAALLHFRPELLIWAVLLATLGNTLGGLTTVWLARRLPDPPDGRAVRWARRFGVGSLALSWLPVVGDGLCALAGWLRWPWGPVLFWILLGKALRYVVLAAIVLNPAWSLG
jgi:membrane protein YqaA with SNARE-associated domain